MGHRPTSKQGSAKTATSRSIFHARFTRRASPTRFRVPRRARLRPVPGDDDLPTLPRHAATRTETCAPTEPRFPTWRWAHEFTPSSMTRRCAVTVRRAPSDMQGGGVNKSVRVLGAAAGAVLAATFFVWLLVHVGGKDTWRALGCSGPLVVFGLVPFAVGMSMDSLGTMVILRAMGRRTTFAQMLPVRIASEALHFSIPGGFVASDTATALLLSSRSDVKIPDGVVALIARKWLVMRAHAIHVSSARWWVFRPLGELSRARRRRGRSPPAGRGQISRSSPVASRCARSAASCFGRGTFVSNPRRFLVVVSLSRAFAGG